MQRRGFVLIELSSSIHQLAGVEEYVTSLKEGNLMAVSEFVEMDRINIDAVVSEVSSLTVSDLLRI